MLAGTLDLLGENSYTLNEGLLEGFVLSVDGGLNVEQANARCIIFMYYFAKRQQGSQSSCAAVAAVAAKTINEAGLLKNNETIETLTQNLSKYYVAKDHLGYPTYYRMPWDLKNIGYLKNLRVIFRKDDTDDAPLVDDKYIQGLISGVAKYKKNETSNEAKDGVTVNKQSEQKEPLQNSSVIQAIVSRGDGFTASRKSSQDKSESNAANASTSPAPAQVGNEPVSKATLA